MATKKAATAESGPKWEVIAKQIGEQAGPGWEPFSSFVSPHTNTVMVLYRRELTSSQ